MIVLEVTQDDIDTANAQRKTRRLRQRIPLVKRCPVAQALKRRFGTENVQAGTLVKVDGMLFVPSARMEEFMWDWDIRKPVEPSRFRIKSW